MSDRPRCNQPAAVNPLLREAKDQQQHCGYSCERPSPESLNVVRCSAFELTVGTRQTDRRTVGRVMRPARGGLRNKQLTMSGQPLVVLNANWSKHHRWQVDVHNALLSQLVVKVTASVVIDIGDYVRRRIFLFASNFDAIQTSRRQHQWRMVVSNEQA